MRNFFFLLLALSLFTFAACGDDDADSPAELNQTNIVGDWNLTVFNNDADISIAGLGDTRVTSELASSNVVVSFAAGGTWTSTGEFDLTVVSDTTTTETYTDGIGSGTYTVTSTQLTMTGIDAGDEADVEGPSVFTVRNFQENMLIDLSGNVMETIMDPFFGLTITTDITTEMTLER